MLKQDKISKYAEMWTYPKKVKLSGWSQYSKNHYKDRRMRLCTNNGTEKDGEMKATFSTF